MVNWSKGKGGSLPRTKAPLLYLPAKIPSKWVDILLLIPGYNALTTAGDCRFDPDAAQRSIDFFAECIHHVKAVPGNPPFLLEPWQQAINANLMGWKRPDGTRRYREMLLFVPRKNGKTPWAAGLVLQLLTTDKEPGAEIYSAAGDKEQGALIFEHARLMVREDDMLAERLKVYDNAQSKAITFEAAGGSYKVVSALPGSKHGFNSHAVFVDELHVQRDRKLVEALTSSVSARRQPLIIYTTTSDYARDSICNEKYDYACQVRDGLVDDPAFLPVIYELPAKVLEEDPEAWQKEEHWYAANPNLGISKSVEYMRREVLMAKSMPSKLNEFLRLELNVRTQQAERWIDPAHWLACAGAVDPAALKGKACYAGLDLADTDDINALLLYFPDDGHKVLGYFWVPEAMVKRRIQEARNGENYAKWVRDGLVTATPGNRADYAWIRKAITGVLDDGTRVPYGEALVDQYDLQQLAIDPWNAQALSNQLQADGVNMVLFRQGYGSLSSPAKALDVLIAEHTLQHGNNPVLSWMAGNVQIEHDPADNIKPSKAASPEKIDGIVALVMAIGIAGQREIKGKSVYETRGVLVL